MLKGVYTNDEIACLRKNSEMSASANLQECVEFGHYYTTIIYYN